MIKSFIENYIEKQNYISDNMPVDEIECWISLLNDARVSRQNIFICGNGGSAANSSHFAVDMGKGASDVMEKNYGTRFIIESLTDNTPWITALGNDKDFSQIFVDQLKNKSFEDDVLIAVSVSGNSPNIIEAVKWANNNKMVTLGLTGGSPNNKLTKMARRVISIDDTHFGRVEDAHMNILHMISYAFIEEAYNK